MNCFSAPGVIPTQNNSTFNKVQGLGYGKQTSICDFSRMIKGHITPSNPALFPNNP
jgi:hypothetical protein